MVEVESEEEGENIAEAVVKGVVEVESEEEGVNIADEVALEKEVDTLGSVRRGGGCAACAKKGQRFMQLNIFKEEVLYSR